MDRNTVTGLILIFLIFIGFSLYNTNKVNKAFEKALAVADADYAKGNLEAART
jgi:predicted negative regulator of RcsB-dependent stress response